MSVPNYIILLALTRIMLWAELGRDLLTLSIVSIRICDFKPSISSLFISLLDGVDALRDTRGGIAGLGPAAGGPVVSPHGSSDIPGLRFSEHPAI